MGWEVFAVLGVVVLMGAFLQGSAGIGFALLVAPTVGLIDPLLLPVAVLVMMLPLNAMVAWREREHLDLRGAGWISFARIAATPLGVWLLAAVPPHQLGFLIGAVTILAAVVSLTVPTFEPNRSALLVAGAATGVSETASGIGGPPYALVYQHRPAPELRSTVALCFLIGEVVSLTGLAIGGRLAGDGLNASLWLLPVVVAGVWLSSRVHQRVGGRGLRIGILVFAVVSGAVIVLRAF
jgi:uncharacterized membrane protein YfcA